MQEEVEHKTVNFAISTTKLTARTFLKGAQFLLRQYDKNASQGKQSMKRLVRQNRGVTRKPASRILTAMLSGITSTTPSRKTCPASRPGIWSTSRHRTRTP
jgi:hypothetical protein